MTLRSADGYRFAEPDSGENVTLKNFLCGQKKTN
jgi:hypothetical protein